MPQPNNTSNNVINYQTTLDEIDNLSLIAECLYPSNKDRIDREDLLLRVDSLEHKIRQLNSRIDRLVQKS